jgi:energy-coupling factor transporter ATP-binding protein EcfA2
VTTKTGTKVLLNDVSGVASAAEMFYVMGPSGAGKSTFLDALAGRLAGKGVRIKLDVSSAFVFQHSISSENQKAFWSTGCPVCDPFHWHFSGVVSTIIPVGYVTLLLSYHTTVYLCTHVILQSITSMVPDDQQPVWSQM